MDICWMKMESLKGEIPPVEDVVPQTGTPTLDMSIERTKGF